MCFTLSSFPKFITPVNWALVPDTTHGRTDGQTPHTDGEHLLGTLRKHLLVFLFQNQKACKNETHK